MEHWPLAVGIAVFVVAGVVGLCWLLWNNIKYELGRIRTIEKYRCWIAEWEADVEANPFRSSDLPRKIRIHKQRLRDLGADAERK